LQIDFHLVQIDREKVYCEGPLKITELNILNIFQIYNLRIVIYLIIIRFVILYKNIYLGK